MLVRLTDWSEGSQTGGDQPVITKIEKEQRFVMNDRRHEVGACYTIAEQEASSEPEPSTAYLWQPTYVRHILLFNSCHKLERKHLKHEPVGAHFRLNL